MEAMSLARIEEDIVKQKLALSNLHAQKNSFSFVNRLPTETLTDIFIRYARDYYCNFDCYSRIGPRWINISYVCRHWRNIALRCPTLWSYIPKMPQRWVEELLARSKNTPLKIRISVSRITSGFRATLEKVANNVERIQELAVHVLERSSIGEVLSKLSLRAPLLQNLTIRVEAGSSNMSVVPVLLFDGDTPALRTLKFLHCPAPWYLLKLSSLTTLTLRGVPVQSQQNIEEFLGALSCMKAISYLHVEHHLDAEGFITSASFNTFQKIDLPRLSRVLIQCPVSMAIAFIACVNIPTNAEVRLGCVSKSDPFLGNYTMLSSVLAQRFYAFAGSTQSSSTIRSLTIGPWDAPMFIFSALEHDHKSYSSGPYVTAGDGYRTTRYAGWGQNLPLEIRLNNLGTSAEHIRVIGDIVCSIPLTHVQSVHVIKPTLRLGFWQRILAHIEDLRYLKLSEGDMPELASLLSLPSRDGTTNLVEHANSGSGLMLAPALEELMLYSITFSPSTDFRETTDLPSLMAALSTRKDPGVRLHTFNCREYATSESDKCDTDEEYYYY